MEVANGVSGWVGTVFTGLGLSTLILQASHFLDPFRSLRGPEIIGVWARRQPVPWSNLSKRGRLFGPNIFGSLTEGFCGHNRLRVHRTLPAGSQVGRASWTMILALFQPAQRSDTANKGRYSTDGNDLEKCQDQKSVEPTTLEPWLDLPADT